MQKTTFEHFLAEMTKEAPNHFSDEALKLIFDDLKENEFEPQDIWENFDELSLEEFTWPNGWVLPTQESVKSFILDHSRFLRFLGFSSDKSVVYVSF